MIFDINPRIEELTAKKLVGISLRMSLVNNKTGQLWQSFMKRKSEITSRKSDELFSLQVYNANYFEEFNPNNEFTKWALAEVSDLNNIPIEMKTFELQSGKYAVFEYKGLNTDGSIFHYIFSDWLPKSKFKLNNRPHFEVLGNKYKNNDYNSEEEIWIPITLK